MRKLEGILLAAGILFVGGGVSLAADGEEKANPLTREELRQQLKELSPEEREARLKELRAQYGTAVPQRDASGNRGGRAMRRIMEELRDLPPEEREARMRELRERAGRPEDGARGRGAVLSNLTPEQRESFRAKVREWRDLPPAERRAKMREWFEKQGIEMNDRGPAGRPGGGPAMAPEMRQRLKSALKELERKEKAGELSEAEARRLERLRQLRKRGTGPSREGEPRRRERGRDNR